VRRPGFRSRVSLLAADVAIEGHRTVVVVFFCFVKKSVVSRPGALLETCGRCGDCRRRRREVSKDAPVRENKAPAPSSKRFLQLAQGTGRCRTCSGRVPYDISSRRNRSSAGHRWLSKTGNSGKFNRSDGVIGRSR